MGDFQRKTRLILAAQGGPPFASPVGEPELKRKIPATHEFNPNSLKPLTRMLWATSVALGHALTAYRQFSRLKSVAFSPDGLIGGQGYVMRVKDLRSKLVEACEELSTITDTVYDEIKAPHWKPKLSQLIGDDAEEVKHLLGEAEEYLEDPAGEAEEDLEEIEDEADEVGEEEPASEMPTTGPAEGPVNPVRVDRPQMKQAALRWKTANSSEPVTTLPGPRVNHLDPAEGTGPSGSFNSDEPAVADDWGTSGGVGNEYTYLSEWDNDLREATSGLPVDMDTRTEGFDFGIGYGEGNDAHGQGAGRYENPNTDGKGVFGPSSGLPTNPGGRTRDLDNSDTTCRVEQKTRDLGLPVTATSTLPPDVQAPVARADYYRGPKGNDFDGEARYGESGMPGDQGLPGEVERSVMNTGYTYERVDTPYVRWDAGTHNMTPDGYSQVFGPPQGPYVKQGQNG